MTIKTHGRMVTDNTVGIPQLAVTDGTSGQAIVTDGSGTMTFATVGAGGAVGSSTYIENLFTGDGTTTTFTLSTGAPYEESILTFIDGVAQPTTSFTLPSTTSITFSPAPGNGAAIRVVHLGIASSVADNSITGAKLSMGGDVAGDILYYNGTDYQKLGIGTTGQHLATNSAVNAPEWVDALPAVGADGNVLTSDGTNWASEASTGGMITQQLYTHQDGQPDTGAVNRTGTWVKPSGVTQIEVSVKGGGDVGGINNGATPGGAGSAGGFVQNIIDVSNITSLDWVVGLGGTASHGAGTDQRVNGNTSYFGSNGTLQTTSLTITVVSGVITAITFSGGGTGITVAPIIVIESNASSITGRDGTGAIATAQISGGSVTGITVTNGGTGYIAGAVTAYFGIFGAGGGTAVSSFGFHQNMSLPDNTPLIGVGAGGAGEPGGGGMQGSGTPGGIYIKEYR